MMMSGNPCPLCGGQEIIPGLRLRAIGDQEPVNFQLTKPEKAGKWFQTVEKADSDLLAWVCGTCGHVELHAADPGRLLAAYREGWR